MRVLATGMKEHLGATQSDILTEVSWDSGGNDNACDLDLACLLFDSQVCPGCEPTPHNLALQGRVLEIVDFDNPISNDRAVCHSGDNVSVDASGKSEQIFIDTRRLHHRVYAIALTANVFSTFFDVKLSNVDIKVKHLQFIESSGSNECLKSAWYTRTLIAVNPLFRASLREKIIGAHAKARRRTTDFKLHGNVPKMLGKNSATRTHESDIPFHDTNGFGQVRTSRQRMLDEQTRIDPKANFVVLFALSRSASLATAVISDDALGADGQRKDMAWDIEAILSQALARTRQEVIQKTQRSLGMLFPWLKDEKRRIFESVPAVCAALSSHALPDLKPRFLSEKNKEGLDVTAFVDILFHQLVAQFPGLMKQTEAAMLVALLHELFNQVDINGDKRVDWDEFTSHTINSGIRAAADPRNGVGNHPPVVPDEFTVHYELDLAYSQSTSKSSASNVNGQNFCSSLTPVPFQQKRIEACRVEVPGGKPMLQPRQILLMRYVEELRRIFVVEVNSPAFKAYDNLGRFQHDYDFEIHEEAAASRLQNQNEAKAVGGDALFIQIKTGEETGRCEARDGSHTKEKYVDRKKDGIYSSYGGADTSAVSKVIHDLIYITDRETLAAALSDHAIHLLVEQLSSAGKHRTYKKAGMIVTYSLHRKLIWSSAAERLFSIDTYSKLYSWSLDSGMKSQKYASHAFSPHTDIAMDCILIKDKGLLATCSLDRKIHLWGIENLRLRGTLVGHKLGVRCLAYAQCALVSAGFDNDVFVWNVQSRECVTRLSGHQAAVCAIEVAAPSMDAATVVTLDDHAECRMWKIATSSCACVQRFRLPFLDPSSPTRALVLPWNADRTVDDFSDIFFGGCRMYHMIPVKTFREFQPPSAVVFNELSLSFIGAVSDNIHIWDARTGHYSQRFTVAPSQVGVSPRTSCPTIGGGNQTLSTRCEISTFCLDYPRQRRLFVGTEQGEILTVNYATGIVMSKCEAHTPEEVTALAFCDLTKCVVSCGTDRRLVIWRDDKGELALLRTVTNAHESNFTCFCYSPRLSIIVSGSSEGLLVVWDFQMLQQHAVLALRRGEHATACKVIDPYPLLLAGDASGHILIWHLEVQEAGFVKASPVCSLSLPSSGLRDSTGALKVAPKVHIELNTSDGDTESTFSSSLALSSSTAITTLSALQYERRSSRSSFYRTQPGEGSRQEDDDLECELKSGGQDKLDKVGCIMLFAGTDSGHLLSWNLASILWIDDHFKVKPMRDEHCPPWFSTFKPYRKLDRDMLRCDPCKTQIDEAAFQRLEHFPPQAQRHVHDDSVLHLLVVNDPPCVYTSAADGFQRLWVPNDLSPYGEFPLPNVDESVSRNSSQKRTIPPSNWTYFHGTPLEVSPEHDAAALKLISAVQKSHARQGRHRFRAAVTRIMTVRAFGLNLKKENFDEEKIKAEWERRLHSMSPGVKASVEARALKRASMGIGKVMQSSVDNSPHTMINAASPVRGDDKFSVAAHSDKDSTRQNALRQIGGNATEKSCDFENGILKQTARPNVTKNYKSLAARRSEAPPQSSSVPHLTVEARKRDNSQNIPLAPAFSIRSINRGLQLGVFDVEACEKLRGIAKYSERRLAYNRLGQLSHESLPELDALERQQNVEDRQMFDPKQAVDDSYNLPSVRIKKCGNDMLPLLDPPFMPEGMCWQHQSKRHDTKFKCDVKRHVDKMHAAMKTSAHKAKFARSVVGSQMRPPHRRESSLDMSLDELVRPYYTAHDIIEFRNSFNYVDVDLSGSINMEEWFIFMARMNQSLTRIESQLLFIHIDTDEDGLINMRELIAIVFQRCSPDQQRTIFLKLQEQIRFEAEMRKKRALQIGMQIKELDMLNGSPAN